MNRTDSCTWRAGALGLALLVAATLVPATTWAGDDDAKGLWGALKGGEPNFDLRYRFERVDQDGPLRNAKASTARLRLGYRTGSYHGVSAFAEFEGTTYLGADSYNSTDNGQGEFATVADPRDSELNQAYFAYQAPKWVSLKAGRQRIKLGNDRFVGNVGWRQNEQTFDAFTAEGTFFEDLDVTVGYINNVNKIFGEHHSDHSKADMDISMPFLNASYEMVCGTVTAYAHFLENEDARLTSHRNLGVRYAGKHEFSDDFHLHYAAEYANQSDYKDAPSSVDADYYLAEVGVTAWGVTPKLGYEVLGGDGTYGFATPLATLHAFNGWTDQFLNTPPEGIKDLYLSVMYKLKAWKLLGVYHDFSADDGGMDYGDELGILAARTFKKHYGVGVKYAMFDGDDGMADVDKLWVWFQVKR